MSDLDALYVHTATVETYQGPDGYGRDRFAAPVTLTPPLSGCYIEQARHLVRNKDGVEVISETTLHTYPTAAALFAPDSRVTIGGNVSRVITVSVYELDALHLPSHIVVALT